MPYYVLDQKKWSTLSSSSWYTMESVYQLYMYLKGVDYSNPKQRQDVITVFDQFEDNSVNSDSLFGINRRFPAKGTYVNSSDPHLRQCLISLDDLLKNGNTMADSSNKEGDLESDRLARFEKAVEGLSHITICGMWNQTIFEAVLLAVWTDSKFKHNGFIEKINRREFSQVISLVSKLKKQIVLKDDRIALLEAQIEELKSCVNNPQSVEKVGNESNQVQEVQLE
ncbi:hypothetical protein BDB01DRAFT_785669 [Pilobolus umbonatus]|nr:hypothetical protein BDB01DRAFT_785669 [Pilobolus umbonatus]